MAASGLEVRDDVADRKEARVHAAIRCPPHVEGLVAAETGALMRLCSWELYEIGDTFSAANEGLKGRVVRDIAAERGIDPFDCLLDIVLEDELRTILRPLPPDDDDASWALRQTVWDDSRAILGGSDAGAHLDRMLGSNYPTRFLADRLRGRKLVPLERAVQMMTTVPASLFGLRDRGALIEGNYADIVIFDPETVDSELVTMVMICPATRRSFCRIGWHRIRTR